MKRSLIALIAVLAFSTHALATDAHNIELHLEATVTPLCALDFASFADPAKYDDTISGIALQLGLREAPGSEDQKSDVVYETCNDNYTVSVASQNGGLQLQKTGGGGRVQGYRMTYSNGVDGGGNITTMQSGDIQSAPQVMARPNIMNGGSTPYFVAHDVNLYFPKANDLPWGDYKDTVGFSIESAD